MDYTTAIIQKVSGQDGLGAPFPLRVAVVPSQIEMALSAQDVLEQIEIDASSNAALIVDMQQNTKPYSLSGGVLSKNGQPVQIAGDGDLAAYIKLARQYVQDVRSGQITSLTAAQRCTRAEKAIALILMLLLRERVR